MDLNKIKEDIVRQEQKIQEIKKYKEIRDKVFLHKKDFKHLSLSFFYLTTTLTLIYYSNIEHNKDYNLFIGLFGIVFFILSMVSIVKYLDYTLIKKFMIYNPKSINNLTIEKGYLIELKLKEVKINKKAI